MNAVSRRYRPSDHVPALGEISLSIPRHRCTAITGPSGSGKSTLFHLVAGLDRPDEGTVRVNGTELTALSDTALARWRARTVGFVFQSFLLLPSLDATENVMAPMEFTGAVPRRERRRRAHHLLGQLGLAEHATKYPAQLSGGQQQRVAIARALANDPPLVLADEPTGNLDRESGAAVLALLRALPSAHRTIFLITHDPEASALADRIVRLVDGRVVEGAS